jgi:hypothetical protein
MATRINPSITVEERRCITCWAPGWWCTPGEMPRRCRHRAQENVPVTRLVFPFRGVYLRRWAATRRLPTPTTCVFNHDQGIYRSVIPSRVVTAWSCIPEDVPRS